LENTCGKLQLGKIPVGSCSSGKYLWEVAAWENAFEKVPKIKLKFTTTANILLDQCKQKFPIFLM